MKLLILIIALIVVTFLNVSAQSVPKDSVQLIGTSVLVAGETHTSKSGATFQHVWKGARGGLFIIRKSGKTGLYYKDYLPKGK